MTHRQRLIDELASELDVLAFVLETEGQYQSDHGSGDVCSEMIQSIISDEDITVDVLLYAIGIVLRGYSNRIRDI